jgi:hypothetical protein
MHGFATFVTYIRVTQVHVQACCQLTATFDSYIMLQLN